jgi:hypothetical protein
MASTERRNYASRAEATRLVVNALLGAATETESAIRDLQVWILAPSAAERILKRLVFRGLARVTRTGWGPAPPLQCIVPLQPSDDR